MTSDSAGVRVESLVDDGALLILLSKIVASEVGIATNVGIRQPDIGQAASREFVYLAAIVVDPLPATQ